MNWGVLGGEGYVARNERVAEFLARQGTAALSPGEVTVAPRIVPHRRHATQVAAIRVDWAKWRQFFRGMQENPLLERIFASGVEGQEGGGATSDWRLKIRIGRAGRSRTVSSAQAVRDVVGSVLARQARQPARRPAADRSRTGFADGRRNRELDRSAIGVALPPTSLMRARTIGQIASLIAEHLGGRHRNASAGGNAAAPVEASPAEDVDLDALSDEDIDRLLGADADCGEVPDPK